MPRCQGYTRRGGALSFGPPKWSQCEEEAVVMITFQQDNDGEPKGKLPACLGCWKKAIAAPNVAVIEVTPITEEERQ